ncbi:MAG: hypothetical protein KAX18_14145, partial [Candidatus Lokiarchaeota archaeon]|nr:hypothetical protein [Candidatus Lokiarchaeota archaeon]
MNNGSIEDLNNKKIINETRIQELSDGKDTEVVIKDLLSENEKINKEIGDQKGKLKEENSNYKKNEQTLELLKLKKNSFGSEINDNKGKIDIINSELKIFTKELTKLEREKNNLELQVNTLNKNLSNIGNELEKLNSKKENIQGRLDDLTNEKENILKKIESSETEYEKNTRDITGILQILNMLTQNINISVESIKGNIQQSNAEAIESSAEDFKKYVLDIVDIMKTVEELGSDTEQSTEMSVMLKSIMETLKLFTDNSDETIDQLIERVKESADIEVQSSTVTFDSFVQDLMEILENVYISLRKLTMSKSQELYKQFEEISENLNSQTDEFNLIEKKLTEINIQNKYYTEN